MRIYFVLVILCFCSVCRADDIYCEEALRLPIYAICQDQRALALNLVRHYEDYQKRFPSRAHLVAIDLEDARDLVSWWGLAMSCSWKVKPSYTSSFLEMDLDNWTVLYETGGMDEVRNALTRMKKDIGEENWWLGNWPWIEPPNIDEWYYHDMAHWPTKNKIGLIR